MMSNRKSDGVLTVYALASIAVVLFACGVVSLVAGVLYLYAALI